MRQYSHCFIHNSALRLRRAKLISEGKHLILYPKFQTTINKYQIKVSDKYKVSARHCQAEKEEWHAICIDDINPSNSAAI